MTDDAIPDLLALAGVSADERRAKDWLSAAVDRARYLEDPRVGPKGRMTPGYALSQKDENIELAQLAEAAHNLLRTIRLLRPPTAFSFWFAKVEGKSLFENERARTEAIEVVERIAAAAMTSRESVIGRPTDHRKQAIIDLAAAFFRKFSRHDISQPKDGRFGQFARAFYEAATGREEELEHQIRRAAKSQ